MNEVSWNSRWKIAYGTEIARMAASDRRSRSRCEHAAERSQRQHDRSERPPFPGIHERVQQRERRGRGAGVEIEHLAAGEVLSGLRAERRQVARSPPLASSSGTPHGQAADGEGHRGADHRARHAAADAVHENQGQQRQRSATRLRAEAHGHARPASAPSDDHPAGRREQVRRQPPVAAAVGRLPPPGRAGGTPVPPARHQARQVAHRPHGQVQISGAASVRAVAASAVTSSAAQGGSASACRALSAREHAIQQERRSQRPPAATARAARFASIAEATPASRQRRPTSAGHRPCRGRCRRDSRAGAGDAWRRRSRERPARSSPSRCLRATWPETARAPGRPPAPARPTRADGGHDTGRSRSASLRLPRR